MPSFYLLIKEQHIIAPELMSGLWGLPFSSNYNALNFTPLGSLPTNLWTYFAPFSYKIFEINFN
jgi:hypothetical protein